MSDAAGQQLQGVGRSLEDRIDRIESHLAIQQLPIRYALAVDARDLDAWAGCFRPDVEMGGTAGAGKRCWHTSSLSSVASAGRSTRSAATASSSPTATRRPVPSTAVPSTRWGTGGS